MLPALSPGCRPPLPPLPVSLRAALLGQLSVRSLSEELLHAAGELQAAEPEGCSSTWLASGAQPADPFTALACTRVLPGTCLCAFFHGKGYTGHFSYDLTLASAVSHRKPGPSGAEAELAEPTERPPRALGPA